MMLPPSSLRSPRRTEEEEASPVVAFLAALRGRITRGDWKGLLFFVKIIGCNPKLTAGGRRSETTITRRDEQPETNNLCRSSIELRSNRGHRAQDSRGDMRMS